MATDLETGTDQGEPALARPGLKIVGLHIKGLKSIGSLDLPEDGLGWDGPMPDMVMVGGINGSGKTTLLDFLASAFGQLIRDIPERQHIGIPAELRATEARVDFLVSKPGYGLSRMKFLVGDRAFIQENSDQTWFGFQYPKHGVSDRAFFQPDESSNMKVLLHSLRIDISHGSEKSGPAVVYFPSERRTFISPPTRNKFASKKLNDYDFSYRWSPPSKWESSLEAHLYGIRWADLNAKEAGQLSEASGFEAYSRAFNRFFEGRKQLKWTTKGELVVETKSGAIHDLSELSSGEKQVILFMGELLHRWRPGSLILIDEPELHLHESYQTKLWEALVDWQKERGGQVIVATQSVHLFGLSGLGTRVILSGRTR